MILAAFVMTSCAGVDYSEKTVEASQKITVPDVIQFTPKQQETIADQLDSCDEHSPLGCDLIERALMAFKNMRDQARLAIGKKLP